MSSRASKQKQADKLATLSEGQRRAIARISGRYAAVAWGELTSEQLADAIKNSGAKGVAYIWGQSEQRVRERVAELRSSPPTMRTKIVRNEDGQRISVSTDESQRAAAAYDAPTRAKRARAEKIPDRWLQGATLGGRSVAEAVSTWVEQGELAKQRAAQQRPALVDDAHLAVELHTLAAGTPFKLPDSPSEGFAGKRGVLVHATLYRALVRFGGDVHVTITRGDGDDSDVVEFDRPGRAVNVAARTMVVPLKSDA